jgi:hypothetical protein
MKSQTEANAEGDVRFLKGLADATTRPVSDAHAEQCRELVNQARDELYEPMGRKTDAESIERARSLLRQGLRLDPRNEWGVVLLARISQEDINTFGDLLEGVAKRLGTPVAASDLGTDQWWSAGSGEQRDHMAVVATCTLLLDEAGRYGSANALRTKCLKLDKRDGSGLRFYVVAHALMIGDIQTVDKWLKWCKKEQQHRSFWAWAELLALRLAGAPADASAQLFSEALGLEPLVPLFIVTSFESPLALAEYAMVAGSEHEQRFHAAILQRAWHAHWEHFEWLAGFVENVVEGDAEQSA